MPKAKLSSTALSDLDDIYFYIAEDDPLAARRITFELSDKFRLLAENPQLGRDRSELDHGLRSFPYRFYLILYVRAEYGVEIRRVLHSARDIESQFEM
jgi:toxin ParE1/3/4